VLAVKHEMQKERPNKQDHGALGIHTAVVGTQTRSFAVHTGWVLCASKIQASPSHSCAFFLVAFPDNCTPNTLDILLRT